MEGRAAELSPPLNHAMHHGPHGLYVVEHQPRDAPGAGRVVLVHGTMDRATSFAKVARRLDDLHVVRYDRRGYGHSRNVGTGDFATHVDDLLAIVGDAPTVLAGHSFGGSIALAAAAKRPEVIRSVLVYESPIPWLAHYAKSSRGVASIDASADDAEAAERFMRTMIGSRRWDRLSARTKADRRAEGPALVADINAFRDHVAHFDPAHITQPVIVARGSNASDRHRIGSDLVAAALPNAHVEVIDGADHAAHLSHAAEFAELVRAAVDLASSDPAA